MVSTIERFHCIQDSQLDPNGVLYREVPLYIHICMYIYVHSNILLWLMCAGGAGVSLRPPSEAVLDDLLRQHIHLARQSIDCTRAMAGRIEASLNTNHRYTTLQDTQKASQPPTPHTLCVPYAIPLYCTKLRTYVCL